MNVDLILKHVAKHIHLDKTETDYFVSLLEFKSLKRKEFLIRQGEVCNTENFIVKGCLRTYSIDDSGIEHILFFAVEEWWAGDLYSFLTQKPSNYFIDALEDTQVLQLRKDSLEKLYEKIPKFERFFRILFQNAFIAQ